ncbi:MAG: rhodanese-like domain-containing protein [Gammaproteobacteria bacterium]|nr:rhodanese-like domain-containing protein [Gammaproteobacteria bacterium]
MEKIGIFILDHWILSFALVFLSILLLSDILKSKFLGFKDVDPNGAIRQINQADAVMLDVREDKEYAEGHISEALHIPLGVLDKRLGELESYKSRPIIIYCRSGDRATRAGALLRKQGFQTVYKLAGGILAWKNANLPTSK